MILHEFGHFAAAKAVGMRVERFMLFFPPVLWSVKRGETEYGIGAIPLGGFVRISGMNPHEELPPEVQPRAYYRQKPWKRIVVILAGPAMNLLIAFLILWGVFVFHGAERTSASVAQISTKSPAASVLKPGDRLLAVDGVRGSVERLRKQIGTHRCAGAQTNGCVASTPVRLTVERAGRTLEVEAKPRYDASVKRPLLGFTFGVEAVRDNVFRAGTRSVEAMWSVTKATVSTVGRIFVSEKARKQVSSVVGGYETTRQAINTSIVDALGILALVSLSLAIINLFPFLPLDGGHVFWALAEKIRRRPIPFSVMERAGVIGFVLVIGVFLIGLTNDIDRLQHQGFGVR